MAPKTRCVQMGHRCLCVRMFRSWLTHPNADEAKPWWIVGLVQRSRFQLPGMWASSVFCAYVCGLCSRIQSPDFQYFCHHKKPKESAAGYSYYFIFNHKDLLVPDAQEMTYKEIKCNCSLCRVQLSERLICGLLQCKSAFCKIRVLGFRMSFQVGSLNSSGVLLHCSN